MSKKYQPLADSVYFSKYQLKDKHENIIDEDRSATYARVAHALALVEKDVEFWEGEFFTALLQGAVPAGRIVSNAGAGEHKANTSLINCLAGETPVLTDKGISSIRALASEPFVNVVDGNGNWSKVQFKSFGVQPVYKISFRFADSKQIINVKATANHRWIMPNGRIITTEFWLTGGFSKGFSTVPNIRTPSFNCNTEEYKSGLLHGLVFGNGNRNNYHADMFDLTLCDEKMELAVLVQELAGIAPLGPYVMNAVTGTQALRFSKIQTNTDLKALPITLTPSYLKGFFAGLLATDGSVYGSDTRSISVILYGQLDLMEFFEKYLPITGMLSSGSFKLMSEQGTKTNFGIRKKSIYSYNVHPSTVDPNDLLRTKHQKAFRITQNGLTQIEKWHFVSISEVPELAEVFCCEEPNTKSFCILHGMLTGNCTVSGVVEDSIKGIGKALNDSLLTLSSGAGLGYEFSTLRPKGSFVSGVGAKTSGPLPFADIFDKGCATIASAGGRRGAQMATFDLRHPDVLDFIKVKRENGRFRQFNISLLVPDSFFNSDDQNWILRFPMRDGDPSDSATMWDYWHIDDPAYIKKDGKVLFKIYGEISKQELMDLIIQSNYEYAEPGIILIDKVNRENNLWFCEHISASNPCVIAGTKVLTRNGYKSIETLVGQSVDVWNGYEWSTVEPRITGTDQEVLKVTLSNGVSLTCTKYHGFVLQGNKGVEAQNLKIGDCLEEFKTVDGEFVKNVQVISIEDAGIADLVYCFNEPKNHTAVFNGVMTSQCGEQMLPPHGACLLGSIDLTKFVKHPFTSEAHFDTNSFSKVVRIFTRMLDNVVELHNLPLKEQHEELIRKRRHGMGFFGLGSALTMLGIKYGTAKSFVVAEKIAMTLAYEGYKTGIALAKEKGAAPVMDETFVVTPEMLRYNDNAKDFLGQTLFGRALFLQSSYIQRLIKHFPDLEEGLRKYGCRFSHHTSIAPTGTISLAMGNNACIAKGSLIATNEGLVPIEDVKLDTLVKTFNLQTNVFEFKSLLFSGITRKQTEVYELVLENGRSLLLTFDHQLLVLHEGLLKYLTVEDILIIGIENLQICCD